MNLRFLCSCVLTLSLGANSSAASGQEVKRDPADAQHREETYRGGLVAPPLPKPRFVLTDTSGAPFDFWNRTQGSNGAPDVSVRTNLGFGRGGATKPKPRFVLTDTSGAPFDFWNRTQGSNG